MLKMYKISVLTFYNCLERFINVNTSTLLCLSFFIVRNLFCNYIIVIHGVKAIKPYSNMVMDDAFVKHIAMHKCTNAQTEENIILYVNQRAFK